MRQLVVGIDIGTSSLKFTVLDQKYEIIYSRGYSYNVKANEIGWKEVSPLLWKKLLNQGLLDLTSQVAVNDIAGIGITGQMHTTVFLDDCRQPVRDSIMWNDLRTKEMVPLARQILKKGTNSVAARTVSTGSPLLNLLWVKQNEPENFKKIAIVFFPVNYLVCQLTGNVSTDYCDASTSSMYNFKNNNWDEEIIRNFGFARKIFPKIESAAKIVGTLTDSLINKFGFSKKVIVVAGTGDNVATAIANNIFVNFQPLISLGTSGVLIVADKKNKIKNVGKNIAVKIKDTDPLMLLTQGTVQTGAQLNEWWLKGILGVNSYQEEQNKIDKNILGDNSVMFFPHLNGEKTLYSMSCLRGSFVGISLETNRAELYLSILEGLAFALRSLFEKMKNANQKIDYFVILGGGSKSSLWCDIFANVLGYPVKVYLKPREAVEGAAMLAATGAKINVVNKSDEVKEFIPIKNIQEKYNIQFKRYQKLVKTMINFYQED